MEGERKWRKEKNIERKRTGDEKDDESTHTERERERCVDEEACISLLFFFFIQLVFLTLFFFLFVLFFSSLSRALFL